MLGAVVEALLPLEADTLLVALEGLLGEVVGPEEELTISLINFLLLAK
jgi:hypothetical protein